MSAWSDPNGLGGMLTHAAMMRQYLAMCERHQGDTPFVAWWRGVVEHAEEGCTRESQRVMARETVRGDQ
jgi:hypothetical protein